MIEGWAQLIGVLVACDGLLLALCHAEQRGGGSGDDKLCVIAAIDRLLGEVLQRIASMPTMEPRSCALLASTADALTRRLFELVLFGPALSLSDTSGQVRSVLGWVYHSRGERTALHTGAVATARLVDARDAGGHGFRSKERPNAGSLLILFAVVLFFICSPLLLLLTFFFQHLAEISLRGEHRLEEGTALRRRRAARRQRSDARRAGPFFISFVCSYSSFLLFAHLFFVYPSMQIEELTAGREAVRRSLYTALVNLLRMNGSLAPGSAREEQLDAHAAAQRAEVDRKRCDRIEFAAKFFEARARQLATTLLRDATDCGSHHVRGDLQMYSVTSADLRNAGASSATRSPLRVPSTVPPRSLHRASRAHRPSCPAVLPPARSLSSPPAAFRCIDSILAHDPSSAVLQSIIDQGELRRIVGNLPMWFAAGAQFGDGPTMPTAAHAPAYSWREAGSTHWAVLSHTLTLLTRVAQNPRGAQTLVQFKLPAMLARCSALSAHPICRRGDAESVIAEVRRRDVLAGERVLQLGLFCLLPFKADLHLVQPLGSSLPLLSLADSSSHAYRHARARAPRRACSTTG